MSGRLRIIRFAVVGASVAALYVLLYLAFLYVGIAQGMANGLAFLIAVAVQYLGQAGFTFAAKLGDGAQMLRFGFMIGLGLITSALVTGLIGPALGWADWLAAVAVTLILPVQNYIVMTRWVFAGQTAKGSQNG